MQKIRVDESIELREIQPESADIIFKAIDSDRDKLRKWLPFVDSTTKPIHTHQFIQSVLNSKSPRKDILFEIWYDDNFTGLAGFKAIDTINHLTELGYWLHSKYEGKGIMSKVINQLTEYAFNSLIINRLVIKVAIGNSKSARIPEKLNFRFEGIERSGELLNRVYVDLMVFSMLRNDQKIRKGIY